MTALVRDAEFVFGLLIVITTWADVFGTVVVPHRLQLGLALGTRLRRLVHPLWRRTAERVGGARTHQVLSGFGAVVLLLTFLSWMLLMLGGFTLLIHAAAASFAPVVPSIGDALATAGSAMVTLGANNHLAHPWGGVLIFFAGLSGFGVVTLTLTYVLQVQQGLSQRDSLVLTLPARAGSPPSGVVLLEIMGKLRLTEHLGPMFHEWERWSASVLYSHGAHPVLALFRSLEHDDDWLTALGAVLDAAALARSVMKDGPSQAEFVLQVGARTCAELCDIFDIKALPDVTISTADVRRAAGRLGRAGYEIQDCADLADRLNARRAPFAGHIAALTKELGVENPPWLGPADAEELADTTPA